MSPVRFHAATHMLMRAGAEIEDLLPSVSQRGLRYLRTNARRRKHLNDSLRQCVSLIDDAVRELQSLWRESNDEAQGDGLG